ncbi:hypothetical protein [uncultured Massilia sp.]|uniref:hypothetical protein n=1 Tax=uncultured Massilia sp. TaxID=169973 RepID=UPI0025CDC8D1|nr:hypothetical protein [uncultured Massilia sp.]
MTTFRTVPGSQGAERITGFDVDQLLRSIGKACANDGSTALFGLLLGAQQILGQVKADSRRAVTLDEVALLSAYRAMSDHARREVITAARASAERYPRHGSCLTDADYASIVNRYEAVGDVQNADIIRRQWEVAMTNAGIATTVDHND